MDAISLLNARMNGTGGSSEGRSIRQKRRSMEIALKDSYQAETIVFKGIEQRCLINNFKNKMDYDDKIISIGYSAGMKVGDTFFWQRVNKNCIVYLEEMSEDAYFRAYIRVAEHTIKWKDKYGVERETIAAVRGPVETVVKAQMRKDTAYDQPNHSLDVIIPDTPINRELKRYTRVAIAGKIWEITTEDFISEPGIINLSLVEDLLDKTQDTPEMVGGQITTNIEVSNSIEGATELEINTSIPLDTRVKINGVIDAELATKAKYEIVSGNATIVSNILTILAEETITIRVLIDEINYTNTYSVEGKLTTVVNIEKYSIIGNSNVKSYGRSTYDIEYLVNGLGQPAAGVWNIVPNPLLFTVDSQTPETLVLRWITGKYGVVEIEYEVGGVVVATKEIKVQSLL